jgi:predicted nucleic acid-binding protein
MWVIDSGVAVKWFASEPGSDVAAKILMTSDRLVTPDFALAEIANALRRKERQNVMPALAVQSAIEGLSRLFHVLVPCRDHISAATVLSRALDHSVYDCLYLTISQALSAPLVTADAGFVTKLNGTPYTQSVVLLSDWSPS